MIACMNIALKVMKMVSVRRDFEDEDRKFYENCEVGSKVSRLEVVDWKEDSA